MTNSLEKSAQLADQEKEQVAKRKMQISMLVQKIEDLLIEANCSWQEWHNIVEMFNGHNEQVIPQITIKEIKQRYNDQPK